MIGDARLPRRFWRKVVVDSDKVCWIWTANKSHERQRRYAKERKNARKSAFSE